VGWIDRVTAEDCRRRARRFTAAAMVDQYLPVYHRVVGAGRRQLVIDGIADRVR